MYSADRKLSSGGEEAPEVAIKLGFEVLWVTLLFVKSSTDDAAVLIDGPLTAVSGLSDVCRVSSRDCSFNDVERDLLKVRSSGEGGHSAGLKDS